MIEPLESFTTYIVTQMQSVLQHVLFLLISASRIQLAFDHLVSPPTRRTALEIYHQTDIHLLCAFSTILVSGKKLRLHLLVHCTFGSSSCLPPCPADHQPSLASHTSYRSCNQARHSQQTGGYVFSTSPFVVGTLGRTTLSPIRGSVLQYEHSRTRSAI